MTNMTDTGRVASVFNYFFNNSGSLPTRTSPYHLRMMTAPGTAPGNTSGANGTELSASGYTALGSSMGADPTFGAFSATSPAAVSNNTSVSWAATGTWSTVTNIEIWDTAVTPLRWLVGGLTSNITGVVNGDTVQFAAGSITANPSAW
jgi:hypothetical protein